MNKEKLLKVKGQHYCNYSDEAQQALEDMIDAAIDENGLDCFTDTLWEVTEDTFMYYDDAWDYMKRYGDNDLEDAVREGFTNICGVAWYNLEHEFYDLLREAGLDTEDFEQDEVASDEETLDDEEENN